MFEHEWYSMFSKFTEAYKLERELDERTVTKVRSFGWTCHLNAPRLTTRDFEGATLPKMTIEEWREISASRLSYFKQYYNTEEIAL